jgi:hypothetical protein
MTQQTADTFDTSGWLVNHRFKITRRRAGVVTLAAAALMPSGYATTAHMTPEEAEHLAAMLVQSARDARGANDGMENTYTN